MLDAVAAAVPDPLPKPDWAAVAEPVADAEAEAVDLAVPYVVVEPYKEAS